jgi:hypothetical protein
MTTLKGTLRPSYCFSSIPCSTSSSSSHASSESSKLLEAYGAEVFPILLNNQQFEVLEKWIDYIPGSLIMGSSLFPTPSFWGRQERE